MNDIRWLTEEKIRHEKMWDVIQIIDKRTISVPLGYSVGAMCGDSYREETEYLCLLKLRENKAK